jgi:hypothetical protein
MENQKINVTVSEGISEVIIREGQASKVLDPLPPIKTNLTGSLYSPVEFLKKRLETDQVDITTCHVIVNREKLSVKLVTNEYDPYKLGTVEGKLEYNSKFLEFGINTGKVWSPTELGLFIKMNRSFFEDRQQAMDLTTELMNFTASVSNKIEKSARESGDRTDNFSQVVNSNLPKAFKIRIQIFKGSEPESLEVETFANIDGRTVSFTLLSPGANDSLESIRNSKCDEVVRQILEVSPDLVIIEQ